MSNWSCLTNPPYWDDIIGLHNQAIWYANNNFNVLKLWSLDSHLGSPRAYPYGIMPLLYGVLYKLLTPMAVHLLGHLVNMACVAASYVIFCSLMQRICPFPFALLFGLVALGDPIMAGQVASLGQECPLVFLTMASVHAFAIGKYPRAHMLATLAFFIKPTGIILVFAYAVFGLWHALRRAYGHRRPRFDNCSSQ